MAQRLSFAQLEQAALHIIRLIADIPGLENTKLAIIGDLPVTKYLSRHRVASIDLVISKSSSPGRVKKEIVGHPITPLIEKSGVVLYRHTSGWEIEVKLIPDWLSPYLPDSAKRVRDVTNEATLPYTSLEDLIIFKMDACGLHENDMSKRRDACDAAALLELASEHGALRLDEDKTERAEEALGDMVEFSDEKDKGWWQRCLGMVNDKPRTPQEILSDIAERPQTATSSSRSSVHSSISRASSYASTTSTHSSTSSISSTSTFDDKSPKSPIAEKNGRPRKMSVTKKTSRHKRHTSIGASTSINALGAHMQRLELDRPASPGIALTNRL
ncbi:hypothetical protein F53441_9644 [Fusarium austroafricanum]|uniref:Uncharacterized protein n=1 Tax=Fusarium austroafricanum TaxID=2364996 RepID=A0A8H4KB85_9HYPO|nr:hypothetical protein F53441_9644 [Fusarium austroafricanum]